jgi:hypothetical protein
VAKKDKAAVKVYRVLIPCANDATGKRYDFGARVTDDDFPAAVIKDWLTADNPVLEEIKEGVE